MEKIFLCNNEKDIERVYDGKAREKLGIAPLIVNEESLEKYKDELAGVKYAFSTWGMLRLSGEQIKKYLPSLEGVFYAAGTVGYFAEPFLNSGVRVFSAAYANGIPVAEYTVSQILLAGKGYFRAEKLYKTDLPLSRKTAWEAQGNYHASAGLIGLGVIGSMVAERLKAFDITVYACDPFAGEEKASALGVTLVSLPELFEKCDVISNHLANKESLNDILNYSLFSLMKPNATFINTGRGAQVNEEDLARALCEEPARTAVLDVQKDESRPQNGPLWSCENALMTPHIAGSMGNEVTRMADYIIGEFSLFLEGKPCQSEVTKEKLVTMA